MRLERAEAQVAHGDERGGVAGFRELAEGVFGHLFAQRRGVAVPHAGLVVVLGHAPTLAKEVKAPRRNIAFALP